MKVSLLRKTIPTFIRIPLVIWLRKKGISTAIQSAIQHREVIKLRRKYESNVPYQDLEKCKVLVICAHFNHAKWLGESVTSILNQTHSNWQLVIVDDCSTDPDAVRVLKEQEARDPRIKAVRLNENSGAFIARNTGIAVSDNDWTHVTFIDPDDVAQPGWLNHVLSVLRGREGSVRPYLERWDLSLSRKHHAYFGHCPTLHSRFAWERSGGFLNVRYSGDAEMTVRMGHLSNDGKTHVYKSWEVAQRCRTVPGSASQQDLSERKLWLEKRDEELSKMSTSEMKLGLTPITTCKKC